jgi:hypothetical protein
VSGFYRDGADCWGCPDGVNCKNASHRSLPTLLVQKHWYRFSESASKVYSCEAFGSYNCRGGVDPARRSCDSNAGGPLCSLCEASHFHDADGKCVACESASIARSLAPVIAVLSFLVLFLAALRAGFMRRTAQRVVAWLSSNTMHIEWGLIAGQSNKSLTHSLTPSLAHSLTHSLPRSLTRSLTHSHPPSLTHLLARLLLALFIAGRIILFDYQVVASFTSLNSVTWPFPFSVYVDIIGGVALDVPKWLPGLECFGRSFNAYVLLLVWTLTPLTAYLVAIVIAVATLQAHRIGHITSIFLGVLSLVHTLICVEIFEIFDCAKYDIGNDYHERFLKTDHSLNCDDNRHENFENLAILLIVVYVFVILMAMLLQKSRQRKKCLRLLETPYRHAYWWFDTLDLYYRLAMTGLLMTITESPQVRMIASLFVSFLMVSVVIVKPFVNDSHNKILFIGQFCVAITIAAGYVVSTYEKNEYLTGSFLCVINTIVVVAALWQSRNERMHALVDALLSTPPRPFAADAFEVLWTDSDRGPLYDALLRCAQTCLETVARSDASEEVSDQHWHYLVSTLLPLTGEDGSSVWEQPVPAKTVNWYSLVEGAIARNLTALKKGAGTEMVPIQSGWLLKRGAVNKSFRRRFFVLARVPSTDVLESRGGGDALVLFWWGSEDAAEKALKLGQETQKWSIDLGGVLRFKASEPRLILEIICIDRTWVLSAETQDEFAKWRGLLLGEDSRAVSSGTDVAQRLSLSSQHRAMKTDLDAFQSAAERLLGPLYSSKSARDVFAAQLNRGIAKLDLNS